MNILNRLQLAAVGILALNVGLTAAHGQEKPKPAAAGSTDPAAVEITAEQIQSRMQQLDAATDLDADGKAAAKQLYEQALEQLRLANERAQAVAEWKAMRDDAPSQVAKLKQQLDQPETETLPHIPADATVLQLEQSLATARADVESAEATLQKLQQEPARRNDRRAVVAELQQQAEQRLAELRKAIAAPAAPGDSASLVLAQQTMRQASELATEREVEALGSELPTYDATVELIELQRRVATREVERARGRLQVWQQAAATRRELKAREQARTARIAVAEAPTVLKPLAEENLRLATRRVGPAENPAEGLIAKIAAADDEIAQADTRVKELDVIAADLVERQTLPGMAAYMGPWLLEQSSKLPRVNDLRRKIHSRQQEIAQTRLMLSEFSRIKTELEDVADEVEQLVDQLTIADGQREQITRAAEQLFTQQSQLTADLQEDLATYFKRLNDLTVRQQKVVTNAEALYATLSEGLLWVQATPPARPGDLLTGVQTLVWLVDGEKWRTVVGDLGRSLLGRPLQAILAALAIFGLLATRLNTYRMLGQLGESASRSYRVPFTTTLKALVLTIKLTLPFPAVMFCMGWCLYSYYGAADFSRAVGAGLLGCASVYINLEFIRHLASRHGLWVAHFRWDPHRVTLVRRHLNWLTASGLPAIILLNLIEWDGNSQRVDSLGRFLFLFVLVLVALFMQRTLRPLQPTGADIPDVKPSLSTRLIYWSAIAAPLFMAALSLFGYHYTARQLALRLLQTYYLALILTTFQGLALRWLRLVRGNLALEQARQRREARQHAEASETRTAEEAEAELEPEIDLETVNQHTRKMLRVCVATTILVGIWMIWLDVLPGAQVLERELWRASYEVTRTVEQSDGTPISQVVTEFRVFTFADAILDCLIVLLALVAARNIPGLIEVALPQNIGLDTGARYALSTMIQYGIIAAGVVYVCSSMGINWSKIQWLVAALSVGVGFGLQELVANFISGLILLFERPVRVGDVVTLNDVTGVVTRVQLRATTVRDWDRKEYVVPNKDLITGRILNWTLTNELNRIVINVGIAYGSDTRRAREVLFEILHDHPRVLDEPEPGVTFEQFGDSTLNLVVRAFLADLDHRLTTIHELHTAIDDRFAEEGIEIAFPQRDLHIRSIQQAVPVEQRDGTPESPAPSRQGDDD